ncbi:MAG: small multi-drug export protein [bacterium]|nr:small multi-drug export protein [bacterium]
MLEGISPEIKTIILSMLPIGEIRLSLPMAIQVYRLPWIEAFIISVIGNIIPIAPALLLLEPVSKFLMRYPVFNKFFTWLFERTRRKSDIIEKYETLGLMIFVAIPLPLTGAWSGCVAAFLFGIRFWYAFIAISLGVFIAGVIVLTLVKLGWLGAIIASVALIGTFGAGLYEVMFKKK